MNNQLVYYPSFEPTDLNWLKFALLYFERVTPIIPHSGDLHLSDDFRYVQDSTDLVEALRPEYDEGCNATADALDQIERVMKNPDRYEHIFGKRNIAADWKLPHRHTVELFGEKYGWQWEQFCIDNRIGQKADHGLIVSRSLADVYMTVLAHAISDARGLSPITDDNQLDRYGLFLRKDVANDDSPQELRLAQGILTLKAPELQAVSLERIIRFRNELGVAGHRREFNRALNAYMTAVEYDRDAEGFIKDLNSIHSVLTDEVAKLSAGVVSFGLGVLIATNSVAFDGLRFAGQLAGGTSLAIGSLVAVRNAWKNTKVKRFARRYLTDIGRLQKRA